jgi:hypothetical protein
LLSSKADNTVRGWKLPFYPFVLTAIVGTFRSFIHLLAPDGGAGSIPGRDPSVTAARSILFAFALWGSAQLIYALIQWLAIFRCKSLVPLMWAVQILETLLRILVGHLKPDTFAHTPHGAIGNYIHLPLAVLMLCCHS